MEQLAAMGVTVETMKEAFERIEQDEGIDLMDSDVRTIARHMMRNKDFIKFIMSRENDEAADKIDLPQVLMEPTRYLREERVISERWLLDVVYNIVAAHLNEEDVIHLVKENLDEEMYESVFIALERLFEKSLCEVTFEDAIKCFFCSPSFKEYARHAVERMPVADESGRRILMSLVADISQLLVLLDL